MMGALVCLGIPAFLAIICLALWAQELDAKVGNLQARVQRLERDSFITDVSGTGADAKIRKEK